MSDDIGQFMLQQKVENAERLARHAVSRARNVLEAVKICIEEGEYDEAVRMIDEAMGAEEKDENQLPLPGT